MSEDVGVRMTADDQASGPISELSSKLQGMIDRVVNAEGAFNKTQAALITFRQATGLVNEAIAKARELFDATVGAVYDFAESIERLNNSSQALDMTAQQLHAVDDAAQLLGMNGDQFNSVLMLMERNLNNAGNAASPVAVALQGLGINLSDLRSLNPADQFSLLSIALGNVQDPAERASDSMLLFGRAFRELTPLLRDGGDAFLDARDKASQLGYTIDSDLVQRSEALLERTRELDLAWRSLGVGWKELTLGPLTSLVQLLAELVDHIKTLGTFQAVLEALAFLTNPGAALAIRSAVGAASGAVGGGGSSGGGDQVAGSNGFSGSGGGSVGDKLRALIQGGLAPPSDLEVADYVRAFNAGLQQTVMQKLQQSLEDKSWRSGFSDDNSQVNVGQSLAESYLPGYKAGAASYPGQARSLGVDPNQMAGLASGMTGLNITPEMLGGAMGVFMDLLMKNPLFQEDMKKLLDVAEELITPLVDSVSPVLDEIMPIIRDLKPVFVIIGDALKLYLAPLTAELSVLNDVLKPLADVVEGLKNEIEKLGGGVLSTGGGGNFVSNAASALGFADGGTVTAARMLTPPGPDGGGLIYAHVGETVAPQGAPGQPITVHVHALDARQSGEQIRRVLEELVATKRFGAFAS